MSLDLRILNSNTFGNNTSVCVLPAELRPAAHVTSAVVVMDAGTAIGIGHLTVQRDGQVYAATSLPNARWVIGGITYLLG